MNKQEANEKMNAGQKLTHRTFTPEEWVTRVGIMYEFEDGILCTDDEFWVLRQGLQWDTGWSIWHETTTKPLQVH